MKKKGIVPNPPPLRRQQPTTYGGPQGTTCTHDWVLHVHMIEYYMYTWLSTTYTHDWVLHNYTHD